MFGGFFGWVDVGAATTERVGERQQVSRKYGAFVACVPCGAHVELRLKGDSRSSVDGCHSFVQIVARAWTTEARFLRTSPVVVRFSVRKS
jgi:hypothetical protein